MGQLWKKAKKLTKKEEMICDRLKTAGKLFGFLRQSRHLIFDKSMCDALDSMYHDYPRGKAMVSPSILGMATILQAYEQKSDADAVRVAVFDRCWQMVLGCLGQDEPPFSQGTLCDFRHRLIEHDMDKKLNAKVVEVAKKLGGFCFKKLRVALDSAPLKGAGRVEDTINLIGHALELLVGTLSNVTKIPAVEIRHQAATTIIGGSSIKAAMDIDWSSQAQKDKSLVMLLEDVKKVTSWLNEQEEWVQTSIEVEENLNLLRRLLTQDLEPDPDGNLKIKKGVAKERQISILDPQMRHGRKSASRTINGYKQHVAIDMDSELIIAASVRPANEPEYQVTDHLKNDVAVWGEVVELQIDRGYLASSWTAELFNANKKVVCKPWNPPSNGLFSKKVFNIDLEQRKVTCPNEVTVNIKTDKTKLVKFPAAVCNACPLKEKCTTSYGGRGVNIHPQEKMLQKMEYYQSTSQGRETARERVKVEHALAAVVNRNGPRARYLGARKNEFNVLRTAIISNLHKALAWAA